MSAFTERNPGTLIEDKRLSLALHYRLNPNAGEPRSAGERLAAETAGALRLQRGKMVVELLPAGRDKGAAIDDLLTLDDFVGRQPVFVGDDVTDEAGFRVVNERGGMSVRIGSAEATAARYRLADVAAMQAWLHGSLDRESV